MRRGLWRPLAAFAWRDLLLARSYRLAFVLHAASIAFAVVTYYFLSRLFAGGVERSVQAYAADYFSFVLPGVALSGALLVVLNSFSERLMYEQMTGTLEMLLQGPLSGEMLLLGLGGGALLEQGLMLLLYFGLAWGWFDYSFARCAWPAAVLALALSLGLFTALGMLAAAFVLVSKRGNPITWAASAFSVLLGGVYYPVEQLPSWLAPLAAVNPLTPCLRAFRLAVSRGAGVAELWPEWLTLSALLLLLLPLGVFSFRRALRHGRRRGSLGQY